jgi:glycosyltransferase involved in cell wall biosynthesis
VKRRVLYVQYTNPANYPPLEHSGLLLSKEGWDVRYFGIQGEGESNKLKFPEALASRQTLWKHQSPGIVQKLQFAAFTLTAFWRAAWYRPAWVYCSDLMSCPTAWLIGRFTRCRVLYHEHDSPEVDSQMAEALKTETRQLVLGKNERKISCFRMSAFQRFLLWTRRRVGREADLVVLPNEKRLELLMQATERQKKSLCVYNCPRREEVSAQNREPKTRYTLRLAFHGSINATRLPLTLLQAMSQFPGRLHLSVVGYETSGSRGYMTIFLQTAERLGLEKAVQFVGALPRHAAFESASRCDVGLAFMPVHAQDVNMANMVGASNKPFDYLACGLALMVSARLDWEGMFVDPGYGSSCNPDDSDSVARCLQWFLDHPNQVRRMGEAGRQRILEEWSYETQFAAVLRAMN